MANTLIRSGRTCLMAACAVVSLLSGSSGALAAARRVVLPAGTVIPVKLDQALSSTDSVRGDRFTATVRGTDGNAGLPYGTRIEGVVRDVIAHRGDQPGVLDVDFRQMVLPSGESVPIRGTLAALDSSSIRHTSDGRLVATGRKSSDRMKFIGYGAGAGLLIGALTKGNTLTDTLLGAGLGYLYGQLQGNGKPGDLNLKSGTEFGVRLDRQVAVRLDDNGQYGSSGGNGYYDESGVWHPYNDSYTGNLDDRYYRDQYSSRDSRSGYYDEYGVWHRYADRSDSAYNARLHRDSSSDIGMLYNGRTIRFGSVRPFVSSGVVYLPLQVVASAIGLNYTYDADAQMIRARGGDLQMALDSRVATLYGDRSTLPGPAQMRDGLVYVPMQFFALATDGTVSYDRSERTVTLATGSGY